jgi:hypothetical protein
VRSRPPALVLTALLTAACGRSTDTGDDERSLFLIDSSPLLPFPSMQLLEADAGSATGYRVAIPEGLLPHSEGGNPVPVDRLALRDGFSVAGTAVVVFPGVALGEAGLPGWHDPAASLDPASPVQLIDPERGERLPLFAELDAHPDAVPGVDQALLIRPLQALEFGRRYAVVITDDLRQQDGSPVPAPEGFAGLRDGGPHPSLAEEQERYDALFGELESMGLARDELVLAWELVTGSEQATHAALDHVLASLTQDLPADPALEPSYSVEELWSPDLGDVLGEHAWRVSAGEVELANFLTDEGDFALDGAGLPLLQGRDGVYWMAFVPDSLRDAPAGSAPVVVFGHGILASPKMYLFYAEDPMAVQALADRLGAIFIGTEWRGLCTDDLADAAGVAGDFGTFHHLTDKMIQGLANASTLPRLVRTRFAEAEPFQASDGSGSLVDPERVYYFGISLGGIQGANLMAHSQDLDHAVLHVGGAIWSTMLERSSNWTAFETMMEYGVEDPLDRQVLYAVSQLFWDPVDPITHTHDLRGRSVLWQESMGDEQVPNLSTEALARSVGIPLLAPAVESVHGLEALEGPLGPDGAALVQFDPQLGRPHQTNRPAEDSGAHHYPRHCEPVHAQIERFFQEGSEGTIEHTCGEGPCLLGEEDHVY